MWWVAQKAAIHFPWRAYWVWVKLFKELPKNKKKKRQSLKLSFIIMILITKHCQVTLRIKEVRAFTPWTIASVTAFSSLFAKYVISVPLYISIYLLVWRLYLFDNALNCVFRIPIVLRNVWNLDVNLPGNCWTEILSSKVAQLLIFFFSLLTLSFINRTTQ